VPLGNANVSYEREYERTANVYESGNSAEEGDEAGQSVTREASGARCLRRARSASHSSWGLRTHLNNVRALVRRNIRKSWSVISLASLP